jgi:hypothetical protein
MSASVDRQGHAVIDLTRNDFAVYEDGVKRPIQSFEPTEAPFSLVMLLDMSVLDVNFSSADSASGAQFLTRLA